MTHALVPRSTRAERSWRLSPFGIISIAVALLLAGLAGYPLGRVVVRTFVVDGRFDGSVLSETLRYDSLWTLLRNTVVLVLVSSVIGLVVGGGLAWLNERTDARVKVVTDALPLIPFLMPPIAAAIGWVLLLSPRAGYLNVGVRNLFDAFGVTIGGDGRVRNGPFDIFSWYGMTAMYSMYQVPYAFLMLSAALRNVDPSLEEQSRICGASRWRALRTVTIGAVRPAAGAALLLMVWFGFALFSVPAILGPTSGIRVLSVEIVNLLRFTYPAETGLAIGLSMFVVLVCGTTYFLQMRMLRRGNFAKIAGKSARSQLIELGKWRWPARFALFGYVLVAAILPLVALAIVALSKVWLVPIPWRSWSFDSFRTVLFDDRLTRRGLDNSVRLAVAGATIGILAAAMLALLVQRARNPLVRVLDSLVKLPATISTIVIAVGFILAFGGSPFNLQGTFLILLLAYVTLYMPQASVAADSAASQVGRELVEASRISGAGGGRTFGRVSVPLMMPGLIAGWALLFVRMTGDLTASSLLAGTGNPVVGFRVLELYGGGNWGNLAALSILLTGVTTLVLVVVQGWSRWQARSWSTSRAVPRVEAPT